MNFQTTIRTALLCAAFLAPFATTPTGADDAQTASVTTLANTVPSGTRRAVIVCGLSGDAAHHKLFAESIVKLQQGLTSQLGFAAGDVQILFGDAAQQSDAEVIQTAKRATREELEKVVATLRETLQAEDALWVIVLGHSHYDGKHSSLNLSGPDIHQLDFAKLFNGIACRQQVFVVTTPTSGFYVKPLSAKGRIIFTATEADWESNETEFPHELARVLAAPPESKEFDMDGAITLFDLYVTVVRNLAQSYLERELLATEHPLLDDNGDGRGTEVQIDYLTDEQGGRAKPNRPIKFTLAPTADGAFSKTVLLHPVFQTAAP
jgi:hypothetical protein